MNTLIVYYSMSGNTVYAAEQIASKLGADTLRLKPVKTYPDKGFRKFFWGGKSALMSERPALEPYSFKQENYEQIVFGFPVWASCVTPPLRSFIEENRAGLEGKRLAAFACQKGSGAEKALAALRALLGVESLAAEAVFIDPKQKQGPETNQKIADFCEKLK